MKIFEMEQAVNNWHLRACKLFEYAEKNKDNFVKSFKSYYLALKMYKRVENGMKLINECRNSNIL